NIVGPDHRNAGVSVFDDYVFDGDVAGLDPHPRGALDRPGTTPDDPQAPNRGSGGPDDESAGGAVAHHGGSILAHQSHRHVDHHPTVVGAGWNDDGVARSGRRHKVVQLATAYVVDR